MLEHATTGDGELTALQFLDLLHHAGIPASELVADCRQYPQVLINIAVTDNAQKKTIMDSERLKRAVAEQEAELGENGRILVRPSGTEALIRVMVEAQTQEIAQTVAALLAKVIKNLC